MAMTLLVLAAGMGSRYGGLKQMDGFGPSGETILEYNVYDARRAGFSRCIFVIRRSMEAVFREKIISRLPPDMDYVLCFQELDLLPDGFDCPEGREKPWGTGHALWAAKDLIDGPLALVNADDFYGASGFAQIAAYFDGGKHDENHMLVAYRVGQTLSDSGSVSRGLCLIDEHGSLKGLREVEKIQRVEGSIVAQSDGEPIDLAEDSIVSMNLFGFSSKIVELVDSELTKFMQLRGGELKSEFYAPTVVNAIINKGDEQVKVVTSSDPWMGVTNADDKQWVIDGIQALVKEGKYPANLWS